MALKTKEMWDRILSQLYKQCRYYRSGTATKWYRKYPNQRCLYVTPGNPCKTCPFSKGLPDPVSQMLDREWTKKFLEDEVRSD